MTDARISRAVPLDQLRGPETDVREHRPEEDVMSLAASMGDPSVGQLQDVLVYPQDYDDVVEDGTEEELHDLFTDGHPMVVYDGETRRQAARKLGWETLSCTIVPEQPESGVIGQLDANTERVEMSEFETVRALFEFYQETDATLADVGEKTGYSESYLSQVFGLMDSPDWLREAWRHPDHPLETSHALAVFSFLSENTVEQYAAAGGLDDEEAHQRALEDARLMVDVQADHDLSVTEFRERCKRCRKDTLDQLSDQRTLDEKRADGQTQAAEDRESTLPPEEISEDSCIVCGNPADRKIAVDVCRKDYGMLSDMKANDDVLMAQASSEPAGPASPPEPAGDVPEDLQQAAEAAGIDPKQAAAFVEVLKGQAGQQAGHGD